MGIILFHESHLRDSLFVNPNPWFKKDDKKSKRGNYF